MKKLLFLATHPKEIASTRHRVLAYEPALRQAGFDFKLHPFFPLTALREIYQQGQRWSKAAWLIEGSRRRLQALRAERYDLVFIHRELFPLGMPLGMDFFSREIRRMNCPIIYDFDDAVFLPHRQNRGLVALLENPRSVGLLIAMSSKVIAGNSFLADYAKRLNPATDCIPTPVDTTRYFPVGNRPAAKPVIAWIGSPSTAKYLLDLIPMFRQLNQRHPFVLKVIGAGKPMALEGLEVDWKAWDLLTEAEEFRNCDIGVYPLWDDVWSKGKCGFKALQFMASGVPTVASAVGVNTEIIAHEKNGLLVRQPEDWGRYLALLIEDSSLRRTLGQAGRATIEERYSLSRVSATFVSTIESVLGSNACAASRV